MCDGFPGRRMTSRFESSFPVAQVLPGMKSPIAGAWGNLAEEVGFEPTEPCGSTVFKTAAFNHSAIPP